MKRRRINKTALHRVVGLLERALAFTADSELRLSNVWNITSYDVEKQGGGSAGRREDKKPRRQQRGGQCVQRKKQRDVAFIERGVEDVLSVIGCLLIEYKTVLLVRSGLFESKHPVTDSTSPCLVHGSIHHGCLFDGVRGGLHTMSCGVTPS